MRSTPATRAFTDQPVDDAVLHRMLEHARFAPNGGNRQGWLVIVLRDQAIRVRIRELYQLGWREYTEHVRQGLVPFAPKDDGRWLGPAIDLAAARGRGRAARARPPGQGHHQAAPQPGRGVHRRGPLRRAGLRS